MPPRDYVVIAGNIGTGKTTVTALLGRLLPACTAIFEERVVYLESFYTDPVRYAFLNQLAYSLQFLEQASLIASCQGVVFQDRSIYDTHEVFTCLRFQEGLISEAEFRLLERVHGVADALVRPTLLVLLDASVDTVFERVRRRALREEEGVTRTYLAALKSAYAQWYQKFDRCRKVVIETDNLTPEVTADIILRALPS